MTQNGDDNSAGNNKANDKENWLNEHGNPSNKFLQSLADNNDLEKLKSIASDLDVDFGPGESAQDLIGKIRAAVRDNPNTTT